MHRYSSGQTVVEAIVVVMLVVLLTTGLIAGTTSTVKNSRFSAEKATALKYAQDGIEYAREIRDSSWTEFLALKDVPAGLWCLNKAGQLTSAGGLLTTCDGNVDTKYNRSITYNWDGTRMTVVSAVRWRDSDLVHKSEVTTRFTNWR